MSDSGDRRVRAEGEGVQIGDHNSQVNYFFGGPVGQRSAAGAGNLVVGDVPQEPAAFQSRPEVMKTLRAARGSRVSVVFAVMGVRGVGKTQVAAAYARRRIAEKWRLVAWVDASDEASALAGLSLVAVASGVGSAGEDARVLAAGVRHWLEADGARRLVVFDNAMDLDMLRPFLPASGGAQVIITSSRRSAGSLGRAVPVDVFTEGEALAFLADRTGLDDVAGARELAAELGFLPLGLAQAAALIAREHLSYSTYLGRLRALPVAEYMRRVEGDAYPYRLAEAITLSLHAVEDRDSSGLSGWLMGLVAVLAEAGAPREVLHLAASDKVLGRWFGVAEVDAAAGVLVDASLVGFTADDSAVAHRLVARVARERLAATGRLPGMLAATIQMLASLAIGMGEARRDPRAVRELAGQLSAVVSHAASHPGVLSGVGLEVLLRLRLRSVSLLNMQGDSTGLAISVAEALVADCERFWAADSPDTLTSRNGLATAYRDAGQTAKAIALHERTLADRERLLGTDHPSTLTSRSNLATAYQDAGRTAEAIALHERTLADRERLLGADHFDTSQARNDLALAYRDAGRTAEATTLLERAVADHEWLLDDDHPDILQVRNNLANAYQDAGRTVEAITLHERTLADFERLLGDDHRDTLNSRNNLGMAYLDARRAAEAIPLLERTLADRERLMGADHPDTLTSRNNLGMAYWDAGRMTEAIALHERTLADCERLLGDDHPDTAQSRNNLAITYRDAGRADEAIPLLEHAVAEFERLVGADHPDTLTSRNNLGMAYWDAGRADEAIPLLERAVGGFERLVGANHPNTLRLRINLVLVYLDAGRKAAATVLLARTVADS